MNVASTTAIFALFNSSINQKDPQEELIFLLFAMLCFVIGALFAIFSGRWRYEAQRNYMQYWARRADEEVGRRDDTGLYGRHEQFLSALENANNADRNLASSRNAYAYGCGMTFLWAFSTYVDRVYHESVFKAVGLTLNRALEFLWSL